MSLTAAQPRAETPMPTWDIAKIFPSQGGWSVPEYLSLNGNYFVEFDNGRVEVLSMPTERHQLILAFLYQALATFVSARSLGRVMFAPLRIRLDAGKFREPDVLFMKAENAARRHNDYWDGADLVMEVVGDDDRRRDLETKRHEYAWAGIPEYWIVDPRDQQITVLTLAGERYAEHGIFKSGQRAASVLLPGFEVSVAEVFAEH